MFSILAFIVLYFAIGYLVVKMNDYLLIRYFDQKEIVAGSSFIVSLLIWPILIPFLIVLVPIRYYELKGA